jgi:hypothetical protein
MLAQGTLSKLVARKWCESVVLPSEDPSRTLADKGFAAARDEGRGRGVGL